MERYRKISTTKQYKEKKFFTLKSRIFDLKIDLGRLPSVFVLGVKTKFFIFL